MIYADYSFYIGDYMGKVIHDEETFNTAVRAASAYLDYITHNRIALDELPAKFKEKVKMAACSVAEICYKQGMDEDSTTVSSETVGNHSKTFAVSGKRTFEQREHEKLNNARMHLHGTGLMYGGLK